MTPTFTAGVVTEEFGFFHDELPGEAKMLVKGVVFIIPTVLSVGDDGSLDTFDVHYEVEEIISVRHTSWGVLIATMRCRKWL